MLASERLLHLTYYKNCISKNLLTPQIPLSLLLNAGCHCSLLKYCSRGPTIACHLTIHKYSGAQINLNLKLTTKTVSNLHYPSIHPSDLPPKPHLKLTLFIHPSFNPSFYPSIIHLTYHKNSQTYTKTSLSL